MKMQIKDTTSLANKVREFAAKYPDKIYKQNSQKGGALCNYFPDKKNPYGCIIGFAARMTGQSLDEVVPGSISNYVPDGNDVYWLVRVQKYQDDGETWSDAVRLADGDLAAKLLDSKVLTTS